MIITENKFYTADFGFNEAFELHLDNGDIFTADKVARLIPGKRVVAFGQWQGKPAVAKIFFDQKRAAKHLEKEMAGVKALHDHQIPTPLLYATAQSDDKRCYVAIFEYLQSSVSLEQLWREKKHISEVLLVMHAVITELATQHVLGVVQQDLHLKNFLIAEKEVFNTEEHISHERIHVYTLDGAEVTITPPILPYKESMRHVALFLSQLGVGVTNYQLQLFRYYAQQRGWIVRRKDIVELFKLIKLTNAQRWMKFKKKIFRSSTDFACISDWKRLTMYDRKYAGPEFLQFISEPDTLFSKSTVCLLKAGRSSTVMKVTLDGRDYAIKRYNMKNMFHWLRRCLRPTRASKSWQFAQQLQLMFVPTAKPVAFIERRVLGLRGKSYFVTEFVPGSDVGKFFATHDADQEATSTMIARLSLLLKSILELQITHGDLKLTNLLLDKDQQPLFIDLDGMQEHSSRSSLRKAWRSEFKRFLSNFSTQKNIRDTFLQEWT